MVGRRPAAAAAAGGLILGDGQAQGHAGISKSEVKVHCSITVKGLDRALIYTTTLISSLFYLSLASLLYPG
jgi:hypothetical protein